MPITVADLGHLLVEPSTIDGARPLLIGSHTAWSLLRLEAGARWVAPPADLEERAVLLLEGFATVEVDELRQSLGSGHLVLVDPGASLEIHNDHVGPLAAIVVVSPTPPAAAAETQEMSK